jgi:hypothetical protein
MKARLAARMIPVCAPGSPWMTFMTFDDWGTVCTSPMMENRGIFMSWWGTDDTGATGIGSDVGTGNAEIPVITDQFRF